MGYHGYDLEVLYCESLPYVVFVHASGDLCLVDFSDNFFSVREMVHVCEEMSPEDVAPFKAWLLDNGCNEEDFDEE